MKPTQQEIMLSVRITRNLLSRIDKVSRNKYTSRSHFIRAVLQKEVDTNK